MTTTPGPWRSAASLEEASHLATLLRPERDGDARRARVVQVLMYRGLDRVQVPNATAGDIVLLRAWKKWRSPADPPLAPDSLESPSAQQKWYRIELIAFSQSCLFSCPSLLA